jgi:hypothetical protein
MISLTDASVDRIVDEAGILMESNGMRTGTIRIVLPDGGSIARWRGKPGPGELDVTITIGPEPE